jgi:hypothetical protein
MGCKDALLPLQVEFQLKIRIDWLLAAKLIFRSHSS